jgi:nucleoside-diphosphate-sugar epimerase
MGGRFYDEMAKEPKMNWKNTRTLVTGGASFIGSALVDALVERELSTISAADGVKT